MSTTNTKGIAMAVGIFLVLSLIVFGSILYVGFASVNTEIVVVDTMEDEGMRLGDYLLAQEADYKGWRSDTEENVIESIRRGDIEYVPDQSPREPPVIRDPAPVNPMDPVRPSEPVDGLDRCGRCPPVVRDPRFGEYFEPIYKSLPPLYDVGDALEE